MADRGGEGGSGNKAEGGDVHVKADIESANLKRAQQLQMLPCHDSCMSE